MSKKFIAATLAATIALTSFTATPALAGKNDTAKILGGIAALYIISRIIKDNKRDKRVVAKPTVPSRCLKTFETRRGPKRAVGAYCVRKHAAHLNLPQECKYRIRTYNGRRNVYGPSCLRHSGYEVSGY